MKKSDKERQGLKLDDSPDVEVAEETVEDESQKQEDPDSQMQDDQTAEGVKEEKRKETSVGLTGYANYESGQPKVVQCEESIQNVPEELIGSTEMEHETVAGEIQKRHKRKRDSKAIQATTQISDDAATEEVSETSRAIEFRVPIEQIVEEVMRFVPAEHTESSIVAQKAIGIEGNEEIPERIEEQQNVPEAERDLEVGRNLEHGEQPEKELQVQQVEQAMELVLEEAVICDARQERMEEAEDIEEPQKYAFREKDNK